jgi:arginine/ornithine N-succinyltransferase beta subunit
VVTGLTLVDVAVDSEFTFAMAPRPEAADQHLIRPAQAGDLAALTAIAQSAFTLSRFAVDPFSTAQQVAAFYRRWIINLANGMAKVVYVGQIDGEVAGFVACT